MTPNYSILSAALQSRLDLIANSDLRENNPESQLLQLQSVSEEIAVWHKENRAQIPSQLNHFLQQSSLSKALDYLKSERLT